MLTHIKLENFKSWRNLDIELAPLTLLFGTNSSGKTAILQSLLLLKQTVNNFDRKQNINFGGGERDYVDLGSWRDLVHRHNTRQKVGIELTWKAIEDENFEGAEFLYAGLWRINNDQVVIDNLRYDLLNWINVPPINIKYVPDDDRYEYELPEGWGLFSRADEFRDLTLLESNVLDIERSYSLPQGLRIAEKSNPRFAFDPKIFSRSFEVMARRIDYLGPVRVPPARTYIWSGSTPQTIGPQGENTIAALLASERQDTQLISRVARQLAEANLAYEFKIEPIDKARRFYETKVKITDKSVDSSLLDVGFGVSQVLPVITLLFLAPEGSIILLEHPELHLHPAAQAYLADLLLYVAETRNLQLIVESHSEHLLTRLQRRIAEPEPAFANPDNIKMYFCQIKEGESKAEQVVINQYGQIENWPENFFGDRGGDLDAMTDAALARRREELEHSG